MDPTDKRAPRVLLIVYATVLLDLAGFGIMLPLIPLYVKSLNAGAETVGFLFASFSLTQLIASPILGRLSDRIGRRRVILTSLTGNAVSMVLFALATQLHWLPLLFASRIIAGATAGNISACQAVVADVTSGTKRVEGMGRIGASIGLGMALGPALGSLASYFGPNAPPLAAAALAAIDLVAAFFLMPETRAIAARALGGEAPLRGPQTSTPVKPARSVVSLLVDPRLTPVFILYFLTFLSMTTLQVALPLFAEARVGWGPVEVGRLFALFGLLGLVIQGWLIGGLSRRFGEHRLVIAGILASGTGLLAISAAHTGWALVGAFCIFGMGLSATNPLLTAITSERAGPELRGAALGVAQSVGGLARTIGPVATGALYAHIGPSSPFVAGACTAVVALIVATMTRPRRAPAPAEVTGS